MNAGLILMPSPAIHGRSARDLLPRTRERGIGGARAALETFYRAFNAGDRELLLTLWADEPLVHLDDPLGRSVRGHGEIAELYRSLVRRGVLAWIQFDEILEISTNESVIFVGRERGMVMTTDDIVPLRIRATHCLSWIESVSAWRWVHHHGSIEEPELMARYQRAAGLRPSWDR